jgi:hypothetical protein
MRYRKLRIAWSVLCGVACVIVVALSQGVDADDLSSVFDHAIGNETYIDGEYVPPIPLLPTAGLCGSCNWTQSFAGVTPHSGIDFLASANGNSDIDAVGIGISKELGGTILPQPYLVSFYIAKYDDRYVGIPDKTLNGVPFSDFSELRIGGPDGTMTWSNTPTPQNDTEWVRWSGTYTPVTSDVGLPFVFRAIWNERAQTSIAIDGPISAVPVPEPGAFVLCCLGWLLIVLWKVPM